jgi:hypothetical protein
MERTKPMTPRLYVSVTYYPRPDSSSYHSTAYPMDLEPDWADLHALQERLDRVTTEWAADLAYLHRRADDAVEARKEPF